MALPSCVMTEQQVINGFMAAPPLIDQQILDLSMKFPSWTRDLPKYTPFPLGQGTEYQQIVFRGEYPPIERGFDKWATLGNAQGCDPCNDNCSYNITRFGGTGLDRKATKLMHRDFVSPNYCIKSIQTTYDFEQVMAKIIQNLYMQTDFFKDQNVAFNALTMFAKKYVVDSGGAKPNTANPYVYRAAGTARLSALNIEIFQFFYEWMRRIPDVIPYDVVNGAPIYACVCSGELLSRLYRDDPQLRQDVRFSGLANDLVSKYNFMSTIRGMFITAPILFPRRFNLDAVTGVATEVLPTVTGIPMEVGTYSGVNPAYMAATHEEVLLHGKYPFEVLYQPTAQTAGEGTSFGPEYSWLDNWQWINPQTNTDFFRREGFFASSATIGIAPQHSEGIFGILVERASPAIMAAWNPTPVCPPTLPDCDNEVPAVLCPCPLILSYTANPVTDGNIFINLAAPLETTVGADIDLGISSGGYITVEVAAISSDNLSLEVILPEGVTLPDCDPFTSIFCDNTLGCSASVVSYNVNCADNTRIDLVLSNNVKAGAGDSITIYYGDGTSATVTVISVDMLTNAMTVDVGGSAFCDNVNGVVAICVPTATDSSCPSCEPITCTQCET